MSIEADHTCWPLAIYLPCNYLQNDQGTGFKGLRMALNYKASDWYGMGRMCVYRHNELRCKRSFTTYIYTTTCVRLGQEGFKQGNSDGSPQNTDKANLQKQKQILITDILNCCNIRVTQHIKEIVSTTIWNGTTSTNWTVVYKSCGNKLEIYPYIIIMGIACNVLHSIHSVNPYWRICYCSLRWS